MSEVHCPECGAHVATLHNANTVASHGTRAARTDIDKHLMLWLHDFPFGGRHPSAALLESFNYWAEVNGLPTVTQRVLVEALTRRGAKYARTAQHRLYYFPDYDDIVLPLVRPGDPIVPSVRDSRAAIGITPHLDAAELRRRLGELQTLIPPPAWGSHAPLPPSDQGEQSQA